MPKILRFKREFFLTPDDMINYDYIQNYYVKNDPYVYVLLNKDGSMKKIKFDPQFFSEHSASVSKVSSDET